MSLMNVLQVGLCDVLQTWQVKVFVCEVFLLTEYDIFAFSSCFNFYFCKRICF